jgi:hypothetical protein
LYDLTVFPLVLEAGREHYDLPGFLAASAPRKAARMRQQDQLILYWKVIHTSGGGTAFTPSQQQEILARLSETYFTTAGSVTAGLRAAMARLNDFLLRRNLRAGQEGQLAGVMTLASLHGGSVYIASAGPVHTFVLGKNKVLHFANDPAHGSPAAGRGLGFARTPPIRFHQAEVAPSDLLLITPDAPAGWTEKTLAGSPQNSFDHLRRRLVAEAGVEMQALVVRLQPGKGQVTRYQPPLERTQRAANAAPAESFAPAATAAPAPSTSETPALDVPAVEPELEQPEAVSEEELADVEEPVFEAPSDGTPETTQTIDDEDSVKENAESLVEVEAETPIAYYTPAEEESAAETKIPADGVFLNSTDPSAVEDPSPRPPVESYEASGRIVPPETGKWISAPRIKRPAADGGATSAAEAPAPPKKAPPVKVKPPRAVPEGPPPKEQLRRVLASAWNKGSTARAHSRSAMGRMVQRAFPRRTEPLINLSPAWMLIIALLIPLAVVTAATTVYFEAGRSEQFEILFDQARNYAAQASQATDPAQVKAGWSLAYSLTLRAENYGSTAESEALRRYALSIIDEMDGIVRLPFTPAINGSLPAGVNITRMVPTLNEVYLLDSSEGRILRLIRTTSSNYEYDPNFQCGPGKAGEITVGPLIDLAPLPINNDLRASIMGIDANGSLVYCTVGKAGFDARPLVRPDLGWGRIVGITSFGDVLYVLDPGTNAVYYFNGSNGIFTNPPHLYFDDDIPFMEDVIGLAVDQEFLYLLHRTGRMTICTSGAFTFAQTRCTDPAPYGDSRMGYEPAPLSFEGANFIQLQTTQPPDPSLFTLDAANQSIYHLSLRKLNLQRQYRAFPETDFPLPASPPTAFVITPNRRALIAFGSDIFFAPLP